MNRYQVEIQRTIVQFATVTVEAEDPEAAKAEALTEARTFADWDDGGCVDETADGYDTGEVTEIEPFFTDDMELPKAHS